MSNFQKTYYIYFTELQCLNNYYENKYLKHEKVGTQIHKNCLKQTYNNIVLISKTKKFILYIVNNEIVRLIVVTLII